MARNEGNILISCATSLALQLIKLHEKLDHPPPEGNTNVIYSSADKIKKKDESKLKTSKEAPIVCSRDGQLKLNKEQFISSNEQSNNIACTRNNEQRTVKLKKSDMWPEEPKRICNQMVQQC